MVEEGLQKANELLQSVATQVYGERMTLMLVDPKSIRLLGKNARYMTKPKFDQLTDNIKQDGLLSSVPLCHTLADGNELEVLSGNHRVQAAVEAGVEAILVLVIPYELDNAQRRAVQLSHNSLSGSDDRQVLAEIWAEIDTLDLRLYAGLDSKETDELAAINFEALGAAQVKTEKVVLWFLPEEVEDLDQLIASAAELAGADAVYMAPAKSYERLFRKLVDVKAMRNIKNTAVAMSYLFDQIAELTIEPDGEGG